MSRERLRGKCACVCVCIFGVHLSVSFVIVCVWACGSFIFRDTSSTH